MHHSRRPLNRKRRQFVRFLDTLSYLARRDVLSVQGRLLSHSWRISKQDLSQLLVLLLYAFLLTSAIRNVEASILIKPADRRLHDRCRVDARVSCSATLWARGEATITLLNFDHSIQKHSVFMVDFVCLLYDKKVEISLETLPCLLKRALFFFRAFWYSTCPAWRLASSRA